QRTDFIFDTIGEGFGFVGSAVLLGLYLLLLFRIVTIAERLRSVFSRCYAYGVASVFFFYIAINLGMTIGLPSVIGIPLPLISYCGTSLLTFSVMLFILIRLDADRQMVLRLFFFRDIVTFPGLARITCQRGIYTKAHAVLFMTEKDYNDCVTNYSDALYRFML